jgi:hypothetical protein
MCGDAVIAVCAPIVARAAETDAALQVGTALIAVITFLGVWLIQRDPIDTPPSNTEVRDAIAAAFAITYLVMVGWTAFGNPGSQNASGQAQGLAPLTQMLTSHFTVLTGIVVGFYFGADAFKQTTQKRSSTPAARNAPHVTATLGSAE